MEEESSDLSQDESFPFFTFTDRSGVSHKGRILSGTTSSHLKSGDTIPVLFDPSAPEDSRIDTFGGIWSGPLAVTGFGILFGGLTCLWLFAAIRTVTPEQEPGSAHGGSKTLQTTAAKRSLNYSTLSLIAGNGVPLAGLIFFGWDVIAILLAFWVESAVIGMYAIARMLVVLTKAEDPAAEAGKRRSRVHPNQFHLHRTPFRTAVHIIARVVGGTLSIGYFAIPFWIFMLAHLFFICVLAHDFGGNVVNIVVDTARRYAPIAILNFGVLAIHHGMVFFQDFIGRKKYLQADIDSLGSQPMVRMGAMQIVIIVGGFLVAVFRLPVLLLAVFIVLKTGLDLNSHWKSSSS